jgi:hypothetical protein
MNFRSPYPSDAISVVANQTNLSTIPLTDE